MPRGGYRPGSGPKKGTKYRPRGSRPIIEEVKKDSTTENMTPLEFMLGIMNDPNQDVNRRDRMAIAAAPYCHARGSETGKKGEQSAKAKKAATGKFASGRPPLKLVKDQGNHD